MVFILWLLSLVLFQIKILKKYPNKTQIKVKVKFRLCLSGSEIEISHSNVEFVNKTSTNTYQGNGMLRRNAYLSREEMHC